MFGLLTTVNTSLVFENQYVHCRQQMSLIYTQYAGSINTVYSVCLIPNWGNTLHLITYNSALAVLLPGVRLSKLVKMFK